MIVEFWRGDRRCALIRRGETMAKAPRGGLLQAVFTCEEFPDELALFHDLPERGVDEMPLTGTLDEVLKQRRVRWAVWFPKTGKYIAHPNSGSGLAWSYNRAEAEELAGKDGQVVDAADFAENWREYRERAGLPREPVRAEGACA